MKCLNCGNEFEAARSTAKYCSDTCKLAYHRGLSVSPEEQVSVSKNSVSSLAYQAIENAKVYGRQAVKYNIKESWDTRPEPLSPDDKPKPLNRGKFIRPDGSQYQFDACGSVFECDSNNRMIGVI